MAKVQRLDQPDRVNDNDRRKSGLRHQGDNRGEEEHCEQRNRRRDERRQLQLRARTGETVDRIFPSVSLQFIEQSDFRLRGYQAQKTSPLDLGPMATRRVKSVHGGSRSHQTPPYARRSAGFVPGIEATSGALVALISGKARLLRQDRSEVFCMRERRMRHEKHRRIRAAY